LQELRRDPIMAMKMGMARGSRAVRKDPACGTCRKKCRKCDRTRPICNRCRLKGLHCEGYPPRFQFCGSISASTSSAAIGEQAQEPDEPLILPTQEFIRISTQSSPASAEALVPPDRPSHERLLLSNSHGASSASPQDRSLGAPSPVTIIGHPVDEVLLTNDSQRLLVYFDLDLSPHLAIAVDGMDNPFRKHVLPLAHQHTGVLHAVLGLAACHLHLSPSGAARVDMATALQHRVAALNVLGSLLIKEEVQGLTANEDEAVLAIILLLVLHDICELGISSHAVHLTGVSFLCGRVASSSTASKRSAATMFFLSALSWLDVLRGFSGAEKLTYSEDVRRCVADTQTGLHTLVGCPPEIFHRIGIVIAAAKCHLEGRLSVSDFQIVLEDAQVFLRGIDLEQIEYPTQHPEWKQLAEAYRHACLLRTMRWPDTFSTPCEDGRIRTSVLAILECCANVPMGSPFYKRLLFPLFLAATDTSIRYEIHYASLCINEIRQSTGFKHTAMMEVLEGVWEERKRKTRGWMNVPWMEFTCSESMRQQHAYLFF
ncbi:C6 zinc finger domain protein, partial [Colletotrichum tofieldiae]